MSDISVVTDPAGWLPLALALAFMVQGALLFFGVVWHGRLNFLNWLVGFVWLAVVLAYIPTVAAWLMTSDAWTVAVKVQDDLALTYTLPRGFIPALLMFCAGLLYREATWVVLVLFGRHIQPLIGYANRRAFEWLDEWAARRGVSAVALLLAFPCTAVVMVVSMLAIQVVAPSAHLTNLELAIAFIGAPIASYYIQRHRNRPRLVTAREDRPLVP